MHKLHPPTFGGIRQRYTRTSAGAVERYLDPIRRFYCEFPSPLAYENWLLQFLNPEIAGIRLGRDIPACLRAAITGARSAQLYVYRDIGSVIHRIVDHPGAEPEVSYISPGIRLESRTRAQIRSCPATLRTLDQARRMLAMHVDLDLGQEGELVQAALEASAGHVRIGDILHAPIIANDASLTRLLVAALRGVADGKCGIDWSVGPLGPATVLRASPSQSLMPKSRERPLPRREP